MRYHAGSAITRAIKLKKALMLQTGIDEAAGLNPALRDNVEASRAATNFRQGKPVDFLDLREPRLLVRRFRIGGHRSRGHADRW
jgi:hypothetical protein